MKITFLRTGGFAGLRLALELDTNAMNDGEASELTELVQGCRFYHLPARIGSAAAGRDRFQYRLRVATSAAREHEILVDEDSTPVELMPLLTHLTDLALKQARE